MVQFEILRRSENVGRCWLYVLIIGAIATQRNVKTVTK